MPNYVLAFRGQPDRTPTDADEQRWAAWFGQIGPRITDMGNRVGQVKLLPDSTHTTPGTVLAGYVVISADDLAQATDVARGCPGLAVGDTVEVGEIMAAQ